MAFEVEGILPFQCGQSWRAVLGEEAGRFDTLHCIISIVAEKTLSPEAASVSICFSSQAGQQHFQRHSVMLDRGGGLGETKVGLDRPQHLRPGQEEGGACNGSSQM